ncbi:response regulator [Cohnella sp. GCM10027633]|uniref:response regulator transcription factor n=1 Tax=unclassified Cohnella TaxID=2636738 RepID=UPI00362CC255
MIKALIVDDESLVRKGLRLLFPWDKHGIEIVGETATGEKAMQFIRAQPVQLLMTDITMPGMSGIELVRQALDYDPSMKAVILTCHQDFDYVQEALRLGAIDYIVKTQLEELDLDRTLERIVRAVRRDEAGRQDLRKNQSSDPSIVGEAAAGISWLADDARYAVLAEAVSACGEGGAADGLDAVLRKALKSWTRSLPAFDWAAIGDPPSGAGAADRWLQGIREAAGVWLRRPGYSEDVLAAILRAADRIAERPGGAQKQEEISAAVNLSKSYFSKSFRDITRMTFVHYQQAMSVYTARDLLETTNHPVYWIAEQCGFIDQRHFSKLFKEQTGLLPSDYRQRHLGRE